MTEREFNQSVDLHRRKLVGVAYQILHSRQDAEDAVQDATLRAWRFLDSFQGAADFKTWLVRITINQCYQHLRSVNKKRQLDVVAVDKLELYGFGSLEQQIVNGDLAGLVVKEAQQLPSTYKDLVLEVLHGATQNDRDVSGPVSTFKCQKHRGLKLLKERVKAAGI